MESAEPKKSYVCAKEAAFIEGGISASCQERIRREAMGEQEIAAETVDTELSRHGDTIQEIALICCSLPHGAEQHLSFTRFRYISAAQSCLMSTQRGQVLL